jgi:hypothetical protein
MLMRSPRERVILDSKIVSLFTQAGWFCVHNFFAAIIAFFATNSHCYPRVGIRLCKDVCFSRHDVK